MSHAPVRPAGRIQDLVMFLQDLTETSEVQVLWETRRNQQLQTTPDWRDWKGDVV